VTATIKKVDFVPKLTVVGDVKKVSEYNIAEYSSIINSILTILMMEKGSNQLFPEMGCKEDLMDLYYTETINIQTTLDKIQTNIKTYTNQDVYVDSKIDPKNPDLVHITISVMGLPGKTILEYDKSTKYIRIQDPKTFL